MDMKGSGLPVRIPVIEMVEIGAGGGSIARVDKLQRITVGPDSAGSTPAPSAMAAAAPNPPSPMPIWRSARSIPTYFAGGKIALDEAGAKEALQRAIGTPLGLSTISGRRPGSPRSSRRTWPMRRASMPSSAARTSPPAP